MYLRYEMYIIAASLYLHSPLIYLYRSYKVPGNNIILREGVLILVLLYTCGHNYYYYYLFC